MSQKDGKVAVNSRGYLRREERVLARRDWLKTGETGALGKPRDLAGFAGLRENANARRFSGRSRLTGEADASLHSLMLPRNHYPKNLSQTLSQGPKSGRFLGLFLMFLRSWCTFWHQKWRFAVRKRPFCSLDAHEFGCFCGLFLRFLTFLMHKGIFCQIFCTNIHNQGAIFVKWQSAAAIDRTNSTMHNAAHIPDIRRQRTAPATVSNLKEMAMSQTTDVRIDVEAAEALISWKSMFADEVAAQARRLAADSGKSGSVTSAHYQAGRSDSGSSLSRRRFQTEGCRVAGKRSHDSKRAASRGSISADADDWVRNFIKNFELYVIDACRELPPNAKVHEVQVVTVRACDGTA